MQVLDFQYELRHNVHDKIEAAKYRLLLVLALIEGGYQQYVRAISLSLVQMEYLRTRRPEVFAVYREHPAAFNEEQGEIALSVLSRTVRGSAYRSDADHLHRALRHIHMHRANSLAIRESLGKRIKLSHTTVFKSNGEDELLAVEWRAKFEQWDAGIFTAVQAPAGNETLLQDDVSLFHITSFILPVPPLFSVSVRHSTYLSSSGLHFRAQSILYAALSYSAKG